jgi:hypothetical protein
MMLLVTQSLSLTMVSLFDLTAEEMVVASTFRQIAVAFSKWLIILKKG